MLVVSNRNGGKFFCSLRHSITFSYLGRQTYCQLLFFWIQFWMTIELMIFLFDTTNIHIQKNSSWQYVCLPRYEKVIECLKEQKNFSPKIQVTTITIEIY
jgi:hypothetical protein